YAGAEAQYRLARSLDPNLTFEPAQELAQILSSRGIQRARAGQFEDALTLLRQAKRYDPSLAINPVATVRALQNRYNAEELNKQGEQLAGQEAYDQALEHFSQAIALEPNELPEAYYNRGLVYAIVQNDAAALLDYSQALALDYRPAIDVYIHRAYAYFAQKEYQNALNDFSTAAKLHPTAENHNRVCWYGALGGFAQEVLAACEQAVASAPNHGGYRDSRGLARALTGDREGAIEDFEFFIRWKKEHGDYTQNVKKREEWIAALIQGKSPFTAQVIVELHSE
ncbi:MAG TPA: tetratricopeptide repeat protein, partial [Caldilineaceae bacterium]|nr:tetratricopeptide repeat protein [Caldilineaceae bacterium]